MNSKWHRFWISVGGAGFFPFASGTCGSLVVMAVFLLASRVMAPTWLLAGLMLLIALHGALVTVLYGDEAMAAYGPDPKELVSDEQCGQALTYTSCGWLLTAGATPREVLYFALAGFVLFRIFDIIKPPPTRQLENVPGAWGVLLDDVAAGVYALGGLCVLNFFRAFSGS